jgi:phospholipid/cholesterol/gamma-HCH transport system permease protein
MLDRVVRYGNHGATVLQNFGRSGVFILSLLFRRPDFTRLWPDLRYQLFFVGVLSCLIIIVSGLFIGMVVGLQGYNTLQKFGASSQLGQLLALSVARELGPVISALLFAGRAGSALTGVDPMGRVIYPRFIAGCITLPMLSLIFSAVAIYGGYIIGVAWLGVDAGSFWSNMQAAVNFRIDVLSGIYKSLVFAFVVTWIAVYQGFSCVPTAAGISEATTKTVVYSSLAVLGFDFLLTAMMIGGW